MKRPCHACGRVVLAGITTGGAFICYSCEVDVQVEIDRLRATNSRVNVRHIAKRMLRKKNSTRSWRLEDPPSALWEKSKVEAKRKGCTMRDYVILALDSYLNEQNP